MQIMNLKKLLRKTFIVLITLMMIGGLLTVTPIKSLWITDAEARRGGAAGVGGGPVGSGPGVGGAAGVGGGRVGSGPGVGGAAGVGGGPVGSGPGYGGAKVAATPRNYVYPGPGGPGRR
jgi:hypothetical protein